MYYLNIIILIFNVGAINANIPVKMCTNDQLPFAFSIAFIGCIFSYEDDFYSFILFIYKISPPHKKKHEKIFKITNACNMIAYVTVA